jgi:hypothetical protein
MAADHRARESPHAPADRAILLETYDDAPDAL